MHLKFVNAEAGDLRNSPAIQALKDAGAVDTELNEILLKTDESPSHSTTHYNTHLPGEVEQQVKQPQRRDNVEYLVVSIRHIVQSELLTEEDLLLVSSLCDHYMEEQDFRYSHNSPLLSNNSWLFTIGLVIVSVAVLSPLVICMAIMVIFIFIMYKIKCYYRLSLVRKGYSCLQDYLKQFDNLLLLYTKCLRLIQETEVISRGYTRLTAWTPASRIEQQGAAGYQCVVLRHCIVKVCKSLLSGLHSASAELCNKFPLKLELADYQQPPPLEDSAQEEDVLSMESLKFQIRSVALHNSGLLRIIALCLDGGLPLSNLPSILPSTTVCDAHSSLKQSFEFHRNRVFNQPSSSTVHKPSAKQQANHDTTLVEELTSMDIRTQMILKRLRDIIDKFSAAVPDVETIKGSLLELEGDYQVIQEQCRSTIKMISKRDQQSPSSSAIDNDTINTSDSESSKSECCSEDQSSSDSSDKVFEGLASGSENDGDDNQWDEETKEDKETSVAMIKELRNVLTVRTTNRTSLKVKRPRKAKSKHKKKLLQSNQTTDQLNKDMPDDNISEKCTTVLSNTSTDIQQDTNTILLCHTNSTTFCDLKDDTPLTLKTYETKEDDKDVDMSHSNEEPALGLLEEDTNPVMMRHIATMAAKMALKQSAGGSKQEEVFGSDQ